VHVAFHPRAAEDAAAVDGWWKANRRAAPDLFLRELEEAVALIANSPTLGRAANDDDLPGVRRVLVRRTRYHVS
jgi:hypothetical protein